MTEESNIINLAEGRAQRGKKKRPAPATDPDLPVVNVTPGGLPRVVDEAEAALVQAAGDIFQSGGRVVHVIIDKIKISGGGTADAPRLAAVEPAALIEQFMRAARFEKFDGRAGDSVPCDCPRLVAEAYLARDGDWRLRPLLAVTTAPTFRPDMSIIETPGYDTATGLLFNPLGVRFAQVPEHPDKEVARKALASIKRLFRGYEFETKADESVALSAVLTAAVRCSIPTAPMHTFDGPTAGSGKSKIVDVASIIATGHEAAVTSTGHDKYGDAELEKRVVALVLAGHAVITIDNTDHPLGGELLCQLLTQPLVNIRPLGGSKNVMVPNTFFLAATGNNLVLVGDLTRRALVGRIDPHVERPELRDFKFDPVALAKRARPMLIVKALTVIRAYAMSGERPTETPLGSFEVWSKMVRSALTWLGEADPCDVMERTRGHDPKLAALRAVAAAWLEAIGADKGVLVRDVRQKAQETLPRGAAFGDEGDPAHPELRDALRAVAAGQGAEYISPTRLGEWLKKNAQRIVSCGADGSPYRFAVDGTAHSATKWKLEAVPK